MRYSSCFVALAVVFSIPFSFATPAPRAAVRNPRDLSPEVSEGSYIVVFKKGVTTDDILAHEAIVDGLMRRREYHETGGGKKHGIGHKYHAMKGFKAYHMETDKDTIAHIASLPEVDYVEKNAIMRAMGLLSQQNSTYNLARVSHRDKGATDYVYDASACIGTRAYVVDSGIFLEHTEFGGRAIFGANFINSNDTDENGHGTHVSGILGGVTYGVCKKNTLVAVKVVDATGAGTYAGVIAGIQWAVTNAASLGMTAKSVINISLAGPFSAAVNAAVAAAVNAGLTVAVAAGNEEDLASLDSPASEPSAITVAGIDSTDARGEQSNYGPAVDIFAPGWGVLSSYIGSTTATMVLDGTSQAAPHVAGMALYLIALDGLSSPAQVVSCLKTKATAGDETGDAGDGSPNLIVYNGSGY